MPTAGNCSKGDICATLGNPLSTFYLGVRRGVTVRTSDQRYFEFEQIAIQATQRVAINAMCGDPTTPATVAGPMVGLQLGS